MPVKRKSATPQVLSAAVAESSADAKAAGLRYASDDTPGIRRVRNGKGFKYLTPNGAALRDASALERIRKLVIPPAYRDVWISTDPLAHLQATGRDARNRKQYRYHERWRAFRDETKFDRMQQFSRLLPRIRRHIKRDLARKGMPREKILAALLQMLDDTHIRVGNEEYARSNNSYGLTTLREKHVRVKGDRIMLEFRGKRGKVHRTSVNNRMVARVMSHCLTLPGEQLFQYRDESGQLQALGSSDVNEYLREMTGENITAKDFRTWAGTLAATEALLAADSATLESSEEVSAAEKKQILLAAIDSVAKRLNNTRAVCRKYYIHPAVIESYDSGKLKTAFALPANGTRSSGLSQSERALVAFLKRIS